MPGVNSWIFIHISHHGSKIQFGPELTPSTVDKKHLVLEMTLQGTSWEKKIFFPLPSPCVSFPRNGTGKGDHNIKAWYSFSRLIDRVHHLEYIFLWKNKGEQVHFLHLNTSSVVSWWWNFNTACLYIWNFMS